MLQYVIIEYSETRSVYADGVNIGRTNQTLELMVGEYAFDLGKPLNYDPTSQTVIVKDSSAVGPLRIKFERRNS